MNNGKELLNFEVEVDEIFEKNIEQVNEKSLLKQELLFIKGKIKIWKKDYC